MSNIDDTSLQSGSMTGSNAHVDLDVAGYSSLMVQIGTGSAYAALIGTLQVMGSVDGTNFDFGVGVKDLFQQDENSQIIINNEGLYSIPCAGLSKIRLSAGNIGAASIAYSARTTKSASQLWGSNAPMFTKVLP